MYRVIFKSEYLNSKKHRFKNLTGMRFNRLKVMNYAGKSKHGKALWNCTCDCGNKKIIIGAGLLTGDTTSCGCLHKEILTERLSTHGKSKTNEYRIWKYINDRCNNTKNNSYIDYGGRGIKNKWKSFEEFYNDMGERPSSSHSIERKNVDGNYSKENCIWATMDIQARNRRPYKNNNTGYIGIKKLESGKFRVQIKVNQKTKYLGIHHYLNDAIEVRQKAELKYWGKIYTNKREN